MKKKQPLARSKLCPIPKEKTWRYSLLAAQAFPLLSVQLESHCYTGIPPFWADAYYNSLDWSY